VELVVLIGLQASGKSSFVRAHLAETHVHVSKDLYRSARRPAKRQAREIAAAFEAGRSVVVDNTNPSAAVRAELIKLGQVYGARIVGYYFQSVLEDCLVRNDARLGDARVPRVALLSTTKKLELPALSEGFDQLSYVTLAESPVDFVVGPWREA